MSTEPAGPVLPAPPPAQPPAPTGARIPPPPPVVGKKGRKPADRWWLLWLGGFAVGVVLGVVAYQWIPNIDFYFDYWVALALT